jgi:hypothetical protein
MKKNGLCLLLLLAVSGCFGGGGEAAGPVEADAFLVQVTGRYRAVFRTPAGEQRAVLLTLRDRREGRPLPHRGSAFPLGVKLETDDGFVLSFAVAMVPASGPNRGKLMLLRGRDGSYVSINSRFERRLLSPDDRFLTSGLWLNPLDGRWVYALEGGEYLLDEIRFVEERGRFVPRRLFFGAITEHAGLFIHGFRKVR